MESTAFNRLRHCRVCNGLTESQIERVSAACCWRELAAEEQLSAPGDEIFALYSVTRGRLRIYQREDKAKERFMGFANLGDTVGQIGLLSDQIEEDTRIVADIESQVAVISRERALQLMLEIPRFREHLVVGFGQRLGKILRGRSLPRFPRVVGVVASRSHPEFLPLLTRELARWDERITVFTDRGDQIPPAAEAVALALGPDGEETPNLRERMRNRLAGAGRILIDVVLPQTIGCLRRVLDECGEVLWCCDNDNPDRDGETLLTNLVGEHANFKSRIVCVQMLARRQTVGRVDPCCAALPRDDFKLQLDKSSDQLARAHQQGLDRIVRHLRGVKIGLALGGGGARGMSHLGALKVLDEAGISFDLMSGTSAGAMIGLGYAGGMSTDYLIETFARVLQPPRLLDELPGGRRLYLFAKFRGDGWEEMLREYYHDWSFQQLPIPFSVIIADLVSGDQVVQNTGDVVDAMLASMNVPVLSEPILKDGMVLVDGGVLNNLPAELLINQGAEYVIGVDASKQIPNHFAGNYTHMKTEQMNKPGNVETAHRIMEVSRRGISQLQMSFADVMIEPDTSGFDFADFAAAQQIAETGEAAAQQKLPEIRQAYDELMKG